jgi:hypothetical protein
MTETLRHREAFEHYYRLGEGRSLGLVAGECRVSEKSVAAWSKEFRWQRRVSDRDQAISRQLREHTDTDVLEDRLRARRALSVALAAFGDAVEDGNVRIRTWGDFERCLRALLVLDNGLGARAGEDIAELTDEERAERLTRLLEIARARRDAYALEEPTTDAAPSRWTPEWSAPPGRDRAP